MKPFKIFGLKVTIEKNNDQPQEAPEAAVPVEWLEECHQEIGHNNKLAAVKVYKKNTNVTLKEAPVYVQAYEKAHYPNRH